MRRTELINALVNHGYQVEATDVVKNGIALEGIVIHNGTNVCPTIYAEDYQDMDIEDAIERIDRAIENANLNAPHVDAANLVTDENILKNVRIACQRKGTENLVKRDSELEGIEEYLYVVIQSDNSGTASFKLKPEHLTMLTVTPEDIWQSAKQNNEKHTRIKSMFDTLCDMRGMNPEIDDALEFLPTDCGMYVMSNDTMVKGGWFDKNMLTKLGERLEVHKFAVLPSSIHELIVVPMTGDMDIETLSAMVRDVNATQVLPTEQLGDRAYEVEI